MYLKYQSRMSLDGAKLKTVLLALDKNDKKLKTIDTVVGTVALIQVWFSSSQSIYA